MGQCIDGKLNSNIKLDIKHNGTLVTTVNKKSSVSDFIEMENKTTKKGTRRCGECMLIFPTEQALEIHKLVHNGPTKMDYPGKNWSETIKDQINAMFAVNTQDFDDGVYNASSARVHD